MQRDCPTRPGNRFGGTVSTFGELERAEPCAHARQQVACRVGAIGARPAVCELPKRRDRFGVERVQIAPRAVGDVEATRQSEDAGDEGFDDGTKDERIDLRTSQHGREHACRFIARQPARRERESVDQLGQVLDLQMFDHRLELGEPVTGGT